MNYKGYEFATSSSGFAASDGHIAIFVIFKGTAKVHEGEVDGTFTGMDSAQHAAHEAAIAWIDAHPLA
jgi:hypothetical protein